MHAPVALLGVQVDGVACEEVGGSLAFAERLLGPPASLCELGIQVGRPARCKAGTGGLLGPYTGGWSGSRDCVHKGRRALYFHALP